MKRKTMLISTSILTVGALGTVTVFAATTNGGSAVAATMNTMSAHHKKVGAPAFHGAEIAKILGITPQTLKKDLETGQSLAQIAQSKGISEQTLISGIESAEKTRLDTAVQSGKLTATQEQNILSRMETGITKIVERSGVDDTPRKEVRGAIKTIGMNDLTSILGIDKATLQADLKNGESIAEIAQSKGIQEQTLVSDLESNLKSKLDTAVKAGKLTPTQAQNISRKFRIYIESVLNRKGTADRGHKWPQSGSGTTPSASVQTEVSNA